MIRFELFPIRLRTPTYTYDLSRLLVDMIETEKYGYYHATNAELSAACGEHRLEAVKPAISAGMTLPAKFSARPLPWAILNMHRKTCRYFQSQRPNTALPKPNAPSTAVLIREN